MMRMLKAWLSVAALSLVAACGGGGGSSGDPVLGGGTGGGGGTPGAVSATDLVLVLSAGTVANTGAETVVATATALDGNRNTIPGVPVTISVDSSALATPSAAVTDETGSLTATVGIGSDRTSRVITVTARSGNLTKTAALQVTDAGGGGTASDIVLVLSSANMKNDGTETITASVTALDAKRNTVANVPVTVSVDSGLVTPAGATTGANGVLTATLSTVDNPTNRTVTVTATSGTLVKTQTFTVSPSSNAGTAVASDLSLVLNANTVGNGGTSAIVATVTAVDANRNALPGIPVTISVDSSAVAAVSGSVTNAQGVVTATVGIGADRTNRVITVSATSGALTRSASFRVIGAKLTATFAPLIDAGSSGNQVQYTLVDTNGNAMPGQPISITGVSLPSVTATTDGAGKYTYTYNAPTTSGTLTLTASAAGDSLMETIQIQQSGAGSVAPAPQAPLSASVTPSPSVVSVNTAGSSSNQVELRALFLGANNQPIPRVRVRFDLDGNANSSDGVTSWLGGNYAYSDTTGVARGTFTPGLRSSPTNGITVRACYSTTDFDVNTCPNAVRATLTVTSEALSVSIRTNELVGTGTADLTYVKQFVVLVVDAAGQAKPDVQITPSVDLPAYYKGYFSFVGDRWVQFLTLYTADARPGTGAISTEHYSWNAGARAWSQNAGVTTQPSCPNEDVNRNGVREAGAVGGAAPALSAREEDLNWNGELDPRKADVAIKMVGSSRTDANGLAIVQIEYGKNLASWVDFVITVTAGGISGTEARAKFTGLLYGLGGLPYPVSDVNERDRTPAFVVSPYGVGRSCQDAN